MKESGILFRAPMVRALLAGTKTQTRRTLRIQPPKWTRSFCTYHHPDDDRKGPHHWAFDGGSLLDFCLPCPYGKPGDRLWVRETFRGCRGYEVQGYPPRDWGNKPIWFEADGKPPGPESRWALRARPGVYMPRWASRILLEITDVRVERPQEISEADAKAEGCDPWEDLAGVPGVAVGDRLQNYRLAYQHLWDQINGAGAWNANPWIWAVTFRRIL